MADRKTLNRAETLKAFVALQQVNTADEGKNLDGEHKEPA